MPKNKKKEVKAKAKTKGVAKPAGKPAVKAASKPHKVAAAPAAKPAGKNHKLKAAPKAAAKPPPKKAPEKVVKKAQPVAVAKPHSAKTKLKKGPQPSAKVEPKAHDAVKTKASGKTDLNKPVKGPVASKPKKEKAEGEEFVEDDDFFEASDEEFKDVEELVSEDEEVEVEETESFTLSETPSTLTAASDDDIILTDAEGRKYCRAQDCDQIGIVEGYCRYHYLLYWKKIQVRKKILADGKLERYVEELTSRYPDKFLEMIRKDLRSEKDFLGAIQELEIDESGIDSEFEDETQSFIEEVRGIGGSDAGAAEEEEY